MNYSDAYTVNCGSTIVKGSQGVTLFSTEYTLCSTHPLGELREHDHLAVLSRLYFVLDHIFVGGHIGERCMGNKDVGVLSPRTLSLGSSPYILSKRQLYEL